MQRDLGGPFRAEFERRDATYRLESLYRYFKNIPAQKFDLIVGNPPHFNYELPYNEEAVHYEEHRKHMDLDWKCHIDFYNNVKDYLAPNGQIILMENVKGSSATLFYDMIRKNGLRIADHKTSMKWSDDIWYIRVVHAD